MRKSSGGVAAIVALGLTAIGSPSIWAQPAEDVPWYEQARGEVRLGAYYLRSARTQVLIESLSNPLAATVNFQRELGLESRTTAARVRFAYQFNARHRLDLSYFSVEREGEKPIIEREIGLGNITIPVGASVRSHYDTSIIKLSYTNVFYRTDKVRLGFSAGANLIDLDVGARFFITPVHTGEPDQTEERRAGSGPLPVIGGRLSYSISPKWLQLTSIDFLSVETGDYGGIVTNLEVLLENRVTRNFGWGMGLEFLLVDVNAADGELSGTFQNSIRGVNLYASMYF